MNLKTEILTDSTKNKELVQDGYTSVSCFTLQELQSVLNDVLSDINKNGSELKGQQNKLNNVTFHSTFLDTDINYKKSVWKHLKPLFERVLTDHFKDHKIIQTSIFNKPPGEGFISPHQNLTTVDEEQFTSISIWIPLQDTNPINGTLCLLPKSQGRFEKFRNGDIWWSPLSLTDKIEDYGMVSLDVNAGNALIFDDSLVHASPTNNGTENRLVFHALAIPKSASAIYCHKRIDLIDIIEVEDDFWQFNTPGSPVPAGPIVRSVPYVERVYTMETLRNEVSS